MKRRIIVLSVLIALLGVAGYVGLTMAGDGDLDPTFSTNGLVTTDIENYDDEARGVAVQTNGRIVVAGKYSDGTDDGLVIARYMSDGTLDTHFGTGGIVKYDPGSGDDQLYDVAIDGDQKIVVVGYAHNGTDNDIIVMRLNSDGSLDTTFDTDGIVITDIDSDEDYGQAVYVQKGGNIVVAGYTYGSSWDIAVVRYTSSGALDTTFDSDGIVVTDVNSRNQFGRDITINSSSKILVTGEHYPPGTTDVLVLQYNSDGSLDTAFDTDGVKILDVGGSYDYPYSIAVQGDQKIVIGLEAYVVDNYDFAAARLNADGSLDTTFSGDGIITKDFGNGESENVRALVIQSDGKIVLGGQAGVSGYPFGLFRLNTDGTPDTSFGGDGMVTTAFNTESSIICDLALQSDGKIVAAGIASDSGEYDIGLSRYGTENAAVRADFDGDGTTDISVYRPSLGNWYIAGQGSQSWGLPGDLPVPADYDGDGAVDIAVYRPSNGKWYIIGVGTIKWGQADDVPMPCDYDGDGDEDIAVYRPSNGNWYIMGYGYQSWGLSGDIPVPADYNADGSCDIAVFRPSNNKWFIIGQSPVMWAAGGDIPVPGDYDGDGAAEIAVYRPSLGNWYIQGLGSYSWGIPGDIPVPGDYDGDGSWDMAVLRETNGKWYIRGQGFVNWYATGDYPLPVRDTDADGDPYQ